LSKREKIPTELKYETILVSLAEKPRTLAELSKLLEESFKMNYATARTRIAEIEKELTRLGVIERIGRKNRSPLIDITIRGVYFLIEVATQLTLNGIPAVGRIKIKKAVSRKCPNLTELAEGLETLFSVYSFTIFMIDLNNLFHFIQKFNLSLSEAIGKIVTQPDIGKTCLDVEKRIEIAYREVLEKAFEPYLFIWKEPDNTIIAKEPEEEYRKKINTFIQSLLNQPLPPLAAEKILNQAEAVLKNVDLVLTAQIEKFNTMKKALASLREKIVEKYKDVQTK